MICLVQLALPHEILFDDEASRLKISEIYFLHFFDEEILFDDDLGDKQKSEERILSMIFI